MLKIPHNSEFELLYKLAFEKQVQQDRLTNSKLKELCESNWHWKSREAEFFSNKKTKGKK